MDELEEGLLRDILSFYKGKDSDLVPILLEVQANFGYLSKEAIELVSSFLNISEGQVYSVASFYVHFRLLPLGKQRVMVCRGTACHIRGAPKILEEIEKSIGISEGETTSDIEYTLDTVACIGCCALAPCVKVNSNVHGEMTPEKVTELFPTSGKGE